MSAAMTSNRLPREEATLPSSLRNLRSTDNVASDWLKAHLDPTITIATITCEVSAIPESIFEGALGVAPIRLSSPGRTINTVTQRAPQKTPPQDRQRTIQAMTCDKRFGVVIDGDVTWPAALPESLAAI
jgi:hypothetical protein